MQTKLVLTLHTRTALVTTETVRAALGIDAETVATRVDSGEIRWVFDVSAATGDQDNRLRELRFWLREVIAPGSAHQMAPRDVVEAIVGSPSREFFRSGEVAHLLLVSDPHVGRLWQRGFLPGHIVGRALKLRRDGLVRWLHSRLVV